MECLIHSPAFNNVEMAWVAGVGVAVHALPAGARIAREHLHVRVDGVSEREQDDRSEGVAGGLVP